MKLIIDFEIFLVGFKNKTLHKLVVKNMEVKSINIFLHLFRFTRHPLLQHWNKNGGINPGTIKLYRRHVPLPVHRAGHHVRHGLRGVVDHRHPINRKPGLQLLYNRADLSHSSYKSESYWLSWILIKKIRNCGSASRWCGSDCQLKCGSGSRSCY